MTLSKYAIIAPVYVVETKKLTGGSDSTDITFQPIVTGKDA